MIGYLTGKIISKKPTQILLDVNGVGYIINISISTFEKLVDTNETVSLFTYLSVKDVSLDLFGFFTLAEKEMFELLIGVSGVGPKSAQSILSGIQIDDLREALKIGDLSRLIAIPGIGRKTGERLLVELRDKVESLAETIGALPDETYNVKNDAVNALTQLGYNHKTAERTIRELLSGAPNLTIEELIKEALANLNK